MIGIRVDANNHIGLGHLMRCLSVADGIRECGKEVIFFTADENGNELIHKRGYETCILHSDWMKPEEELDSLLAALQAQSIDVLLLDSYQVTKDYLKTLSEHVTTAYMDDVYAFEYPVHMLINYSVYAEDMGYKEVSGRTLFLGTKYVPLRKQFENITSNQETVGKSVLVLSGGTDPYKMTERIPKAILSCEALSEYEIHVVIGSYAETDTDLEENSRVHFHKNVVDMAGLMQECRFAISAGGSTLYELCACKIPTVTYAFVDNQLGNVEGFEHSGIMPYAGDLRQDEEQVISRILDRLKEFDYKYPNELIHKMTDKVDGRGALEIAKVLCAER